jgi:hypothetical protein
MNRPQPVIIAFFLLAQSADCTVFMKKEWTFESDKTISFVVKDTCEIRVEFLGKIPPDFLVGYTRLGVQLDDSLIATPDSVLPLIRICLDAGFLGFSHVLTVTVTCQSEMFDNAGPLSSLRCMKDPYPMAQVHFWKNCDSTFFDGDKIFGFSHRHIAADEGVTKRGKVAIATTGYPFHFGIMRLKNARVAGPMRAKANGGAAVVPALTVVGFARLSCCKPPRTEYSILGRVLLVGRPSVKGFIVLKADEE